ncbi:gustatory and odorant receptor 63a isoform X1 [Rhopalosiphum padi]|uniref:gustatory and odorant receptor 63a isoform X1 n=1 Tax=Rhopalosiphum padi TaxID=40932 RepID=UPI00298EB67A|nr:gustatory and odorant receptor 63a isoform X1 [Rhopalosiphum padi]
MSNFNRILLKFGYGTLIAPSAFVPVIMWFETTKLQAYLQEWRLFQDNYNRVIGESDGIIMIAIVKKRVNRIYRSIIVFLLITGVAISWSSSTISNVYVVVCTIKSISIMVFIAGFWFVGAIVIEATIDGYKKKLQMELDRHDSFRFGARSIEDYRLLWLQMSRLVHGVGDYMSATVTFCIFHTTVVVVLSVYALAVWGATLVRLRRYEALASALVALLCNATFLYVYCDCGYSQTKKCVDSVILLILKLKSLARWTTSNYIQITLFLNAVNQYQPNVNVIGFYEINRGLLGSILSLLLTYLIVLIQLNSSFTMPSPVEDNNNNNNNTIH